ncbi:2-hydroxy-3-oxopropionate reductase [Caldalkalibacillus uzonensis]|uniref:2-hydroxy-3-oxopropionate reductase n=1 Tax=Caldalkalibacillus uzonensis TaxID=353224 RepID=A0ABU0CNV9_9BACI|nr:2-hydroxy-3-oxopropionate reductase [Caldalkalibacillus uzonensis]MDQ0338106.1 2-hydroxy-3-oxopropionate reductase [Caldalkalibacillus uzonensis]
MERIGFIGLGIMGKPMAINLLKAEYQLVVYNRSKPKVDELVAKGAEAAGSPREVAEKSSVIITMLPDSPQVEEVLTGPDGVFDGVKKGSLIIDMSTISPVVARNLSEEARKYGASMLDAPVSGGEPGAIQGTLSIMVGGSTEDFERAKPLFEVMGKTITLVGEAGAGQIVKACNQIVVALTIGAVSEALVLGSKAGVNPAKILDVLSGGLAGNKVMEVRRSNFLEHDFKPGFKIDLHHKDLRIALETGRDYGVSLPLSAVVDQMMSSLVARGDGSKDHSAVLTLIEDLAQHKI